MQPRSADQDPAPVQALGRPPVRSAATLTSRTQRPPRSSPCSEPSPCATGSIACHVETACAGLLSELDYESSAEVEDQSAGDELQAQRPRGPQAHLLSRPIIAASAVMATRRPHTCPWMFETCADVDMPAPVLVVEPGAVGGRRGSTHVQEVL